MQPALVSTSAAGSRIHVGCPGWVYRARKLGVSAIGVRSGGFSDDQLNEAGASALYDDVAALLVDYANSPIRR